MQQLLINTYPQDEFRIFQVSEIFLEQEICFTKQFALKIPILPAIKNNQDKISKNKNY